MAEMIPETPSPEDLQRELEQVRAAQPSAAAQQPQPSLGSILMKRARRALLLWSILIVLFLVIWNVLNAHK